MDTALLALNEKIKKEEEIKKAKKELGMLKRKKEALATRDQNIRQDINRGKLGPLSSYKLPSEDCSSSPKKKVTEEDIRRLKQTARIHQKLKGVAMCYGVTSYREKADDETKYMFDPYVAGKPYGPYDLRLKMSPGQAPVLLGHSLPAVVSVRSLFNKHLAQAANNQHRNNRLFLDEVFLHLRSFLSRKQQFEELKESFGSGLLESNAKNDFTEINFSLSAETDECDMTIKFSMAYDKDMERPRNRSIEVDFEPEVEEEEEERILRECHLFYKKSLVAALNAVF